MIVVSRGKIARLEAGWYKKRLESVEHSLSPSYLCLHERLKLLQRNEKLQAPEPTRREAKFRVQKTVNLGQLGLCAPHQNANEP